MTVDVTKALEALRPFMGHPVSAAPLTWTRTRVYLRDPGDGESKSYVGRITELNALGLCLQMESPESRDRRWWPMGRIQEIVDLSPRPLNAADIAAARAP